jgi:hypothetical protein
MRRATAVLGAFFLGVILTAIVFIGLARVPDSPLLVAILPATSTSTPTLTYTPTSTNTPTSTFTPTLSPTDTMTPTPTDSLTPTATPYPTFNSRPDFLTLEDRELWTYPDHYTGKYVIVIGHVFNIVNDRTFQMYLGNSEEYPIEVETLAPLKGIYKDTAVKVQAMVHGFITFENTSGRTIQQPLLVYGYPTILAQP